MVEVRRTFQDGIFSTTLYIIISVFQVITKEAVQGAPVSLDVSRLRINPLECYNRAKSCTKMADNGYCVSNYHYMVDRCPWSCRFCRRARGDTEKCEDISDHCSEWVLNKECTTRPDFMAQNCKKSCEMCGPESEYRVTDSESFCPTWAKAGWCQKNSDLLQKCPHSCQKYGYIGANSLDERYITVNFQNTSSVRAPKYTEIVAPPPPSAAISAHSDLKSLPQDLRTVLEKEWLDSRLLQLTQKQNEYVTHPEIRPPSSPLYTNQTAQSGNNTLQTTQTTPSLANSTGYARNQSSTLLEGNQQREMQQASAPAPPPRPYDSLLPQLVVGHLTWNGRNEKPDENKSTIEEVWKEEKEEDEDLDEGGQQKGKVPVIMSGSNQLSDHRDLTIEMSSSGNDIIQGEINHDEETKASGHYMENDYRDMEQNTALSGSGEENESNNLHITMYNRHDSSQGENVRQIFPENDFSGSGHLENQEARDDILLRSSGSGQADESLEIESFSGSGE